jgi:hypothetical protein
MAQASSVPTSSAWLTSWGGDHRRFVLSINDTPGARRVRRFNRSEVETTYTVGLAGACGRKRAGKLIVRH